MTHTHNPEEIKQSVVVETGPGSSWILPVSILIAALLISGSVLYSGRKTVNQLENMSFGGGTTTVGTGQGTGTQLGALPSNPVKLEIRKDAPVFGKGDGKVTLVEFSDFQCPFCQRFFTESMPSLKSKYADTGKVKFVFQHYPLPFHQNAQKSGEAAECASRQGKFQAYHDILFGRGKSDGAGLAVDDLKKYASELGLNTSKFNTCLENNEAAEVVKQDMQLGQKFGVTGTPSFLLVKGNDMTFDVGAIQTAAQQNQNVVKLPNGNIFIVGAQPASVFEQAIEEALK